jgi:hypothetical protein
MIVSTATRKRIQGTSRNTQRRPKDGDRWTAEPRGRHQRTRGVEEDGRGECLCLDTCGASYQIHWQSLEAGARRAAALERAEELKANEQRVAYAAQHAEVRLFNFVDLIDTDRDQSRHRSSPASPRFSLSSPFATYSRTPPPPTFPFPTRSVTLLCLLVRFSLLTLLSDTSRRS